MKITKTIFAALFALALAQPPAEAQITLNSTTLSGAINSYQTRIVLASTTNVQPGYALWVMDPGQNTGELMVVKTVPASGTAIVDRGVTIKTAHISGAYVLIGRTQTDFHGSDPGISQPTCTVATSGVFPWVNVNSGAQWVCNGFVSAATGTWGPGWGNFQATQQVYSSTATDSVAGACPIASPFIKMGLTNACTSFTMSGGWHGDNFRIYPTAAFTGTATNNICKAFTAVADRIISFSWNAASSCFSPSY